MCISRKAGVVCVLAFGLSLGLVGFSRAGSATWEVTTLDGPEDVTWYGTVANDVSDSGYVAGAWVDVGGRFHATYWYQGTAYDLATEIGQPEGTTYSNVLSINSAGLMGGNALNTDGSVYVAMLWDVQHGTSTNIHPHGEFDDLVYSNVKGVNAGGDVVGEIVQAPYDAPYGWLKSAYVWPKGDTVGHKLPGWEDYAYGEATGIASNGTIAGWGVDPDDFTWHALLWVRDDHGDYELVDLQDEEFADTDFTDTTAFDVSESGMVVGYGWKDYDYTVQPVPFAWTAQDGLVELDEDATGYGIPWKANGNFAAGGIGMTARNLSNDAVVWWRGELQVVVASFGDYDYCEASSVTSGGIVVGIGLMDEDSTDPAAPYPIAFVAER